MVDAIFDDIVAFSEIEQFIDTQVKFYSSGMYVRLAFAVAVNVDPDILVVDEVLAVGDERFQAKCIDRIRRFQKEGRTILFVTHNADQVRALCDRAVVLDSGDMIADGPTQDSLRIFREHLMADAVEHDDSAQLLGTITIDSVTTPDGSFDIKSGSSLHLDVTVTSQTRLQRQLRASSSSRVAGCSSVAVTPRARRSTCRRDATVIGIDLAQVPLLDGVYDLNVGVLDQHGHTVDRLEREGRVDSGHLRRSRGRHRRARRLYSSAVGEADFVVRERAGTVAALRRDRGARR